MVNIALPRADIADRRRLAVGAEGAGADQGGICPGALVRGSELARGGHVDDAAGEADLPLTVELEVVLAGEGDSVDHQSVSSFTRAG